MQIVPSGSTQKSDEVGASSTRPCGVTSSASSKPRSRASRRAEHVGAVGERLDPVEHARGRVLDDAEPDAARGVGGSGSVSSSRWPPRVSTIRRQPSNVRAAALRRAAPGSRSPARLAARPSRRRFAAERSSRSRWSGSANGAPVVDADHLEHAVAAQQPLVGGRDAYARPRARSGRRASPARPSSWRSRLPCGDLARRRVTHRRTACMLVDMRIELSDRASGGSARDQVYAALREAIVRAELEPGRRLSENELADAARRQPHARARGAGAPARRAARRDRAAARHVRHAASATPPSPTPQFIREALECAAVRRAAERATEDDLAELRGRTCAAQERAERAATTSTRSTCSTTRSTSALCDAERPRDRLVARAAAPTATSNRVRRLSLPEPGYLGEMVAEHRERRGGGRRPATPTAPRPRCATTCAWSCQEVPRIRGGPPRVLRGGLTVRSRHPPRRRRRSRHAAARAVRDRCCSAASSRPRPSASTRPPASAATATSPRARRPTTRRRRATRMQPDDLLVTGYRSHGFALARGTSPEAVMAELFGREDGCAHGRGGSMHLLDVDRGYYGGWGIVAGQLPVATGLALALVRQGKPQAVVCELGDGAVNMGAWHESLNLAALWQLPIVFLVVNNEYGMGTSVERASAEPELYKRASALPDARRARRRRRPRRGHRGGRPAAARARARSASRPCSRRSPTATAATRSPTPASPTARRTRSPSTRSTTRSAACAAQLREAGVAEDELRRDRRAAPTSASPPPSSSRSTSPEPRRRRARRGHARRRQRRAVRAHAAGQRRSARRS